MENIPSSKKKFLANVEKSKQQIEKIGGNCYICCCELDIGEETLIKTNCNHYFHYECLFDTFKHCSKSRECPYCRKKTGYIPLIFGQCPIKKIHKEYFKSHKHKCVAILKSGKKKGQICGCKIKDNSKITITIENKITYLCGRHKNYKPPKLIETNIKIVDKSIKNWHKKKILMTYF